MTSFGQEQDSSLKSRFDKVYSLPKYDFIVFRDQTRKLFTITNFDEKALQRSLSQAVNMSTVPPIGITFYKNGIVTSSTLCAYIIEGQRNTLIKKTEKFTTLGDYSRARTKLLEKENVYILEEETNGFYSYVYVILSGEDTEDGTRFYSKLSDMKKHFYKGKYANYFFDSFEPFDYYTDTETLTTLYKLKINYHDFEYRLKRERIFTREDSKNIFGREWLLQSGWKYNKEFILTWYEYETNTKEE